MAVGRQRQNEPNVNGGELKNHGLVYHTLLLHDSCVLARRHSFSHAFQVCFPQTQVNDSSGEGSLPGTSHRRLTRSQEEIQPQNRALLPNVIKKK